MNSKSKSRTAVAAVRSLAAAGVCAGATLLFGGAAAADPMATPSMTAPLSANTNPFSVDGGPLGKVYIGGALTGMAMTEDHHALGEDSSVADISNAQVIVQTTSGPVQFYVQAGEYSQPFLGVPYMKASDATKANFGVVPIAYVKLQPTPEISILAGKLYPLIGAEYSFTFQNMNVFRGLLVAQEPAVSRGVQANYAKGPITLSLSLNDGFYSNKLNWVTGAATYVFSPADTLVVSGGGAVSQTSQVSFTTPPAQNNGWLANLIWTHTAGPLTITPYFQYTHTPEVNDLGLSRSASTWGAAVLAKYSLTPEFSLAGRVEYEKSNTKDCDPANPACAPTNLMFGPNSDAWSLTFTPTWQKGVFFVRGEVSYVNVGKLTPGFGFGETADAKSQTRGVIETGVLF
jgi:hypothetical protein